MSSVLGLFPLGIRWGICGGYYHVLKWLCVVGVVGLCASLGQLVLVGGEITMFFSWMKSSSGVENVRIQI